MRIKTLRLRNFGAHRSLDIEFKAGLNVITGANGTGKSTLLDGLRYAYVGEVVAQGTLAQNVSWGEASGGVESAFEANNLDYKIVRGIAGTSRTQPPYIETPDGVVRTASEVAKLISSLLHTTPDAMLNNVFVAQGAIESILYSRNLDRLRELQQTAGLSRCGDAEKLLGVEISKYQLTVGLKELTETAQANLTEATAAVDQEQSRLRTLDTQIGELAGYADKLRKWLDDKARATSYHQTRDQLAAAEKAYTAAAQEAAASTETLERLQASLDVARESADAATALWSAWQLNSKLLVNRTTFQKQLAAADEAIAKLGAVPDEAEVKRLSEAVTRLQEEDGHVRRILSGDTKFPTLPGEPEMQARLTQLRDAELECRARSVVSDEVKRMRFRAQDLTEKAAALRRGECPTCGAPVTASDLSTMDAESKTLTDDADKQVAAATAERQAQLDKVVAERETLTAELKRMTGEARAVFEAVARDKGSALAAARAEHNAVVAVATQLQKHVADREAVRSHLASMGEAPTPLSDADVKVLEDRIAEYKTASTKLRDMDTWVKLQNQKAELAMGQVSVLRANLKSIEEVSEMPSDEAIADARKHVEQLNALQSQQDEAVAKLTQAKIRREQYQQQVSNFVEQAKKERKDSQWVGMCRAARDVMHASGLPALVLKEYARMLNARIRGYLDVWEAPFVLRLNSEDLSFEVDFDGVIAPAGRLSGGQRIVASTSFRLAMADAFAKHVGLLVIDEPSNYLDTDNKVHLQNLLLNLKTLSGSTGRQIIVVTHEEQLAGFADHHIRLC